MMAFQAIMKLVRIEGGHGYEKNYNCIAADSINFVGMQK